MVNTTSIREKAVQEIVHSFVGRRIALTAGTTEEIRNIIQAVIAKTWMAYGEEREKLNRNKHL